MRVVLYNPEPGDIPPMRKLTRIYRHDLTFANSVEELRRVTANKPLVAMEHVQEATMLNKFVTPAYEFDVVTGSMNRGLPDEVLDLCSEIVQIETFDDVGFLSPTTAMAIFLHELFMRGPNRNGVFG